MNSSLNGALRTSALHVNSGDPFDWSDRNEDSFATVIFGTGEGGNLANDGVIPKQVWHV